MKGKPVTDSDRLRYPARLDPAAMVERLVEVRTLAASAGLAELVARLDGVESMPSGEIGSSVISALNWIQERPEYADITEQLAMVAMNLKYLK